METTIDSFINYAVKNGYVDDSAVEWSDAEKEAYVAKCDLMDVND